MFFFPVRSPYLDSCVRMLGMEMDTYGCRRKYVLIFDEHELQ